MFTPLWREMSDSKPLPACQLSMISRWNLSSCEGKKVAKLLKEVRAFYKSQLSVLRTAIEELFRRISDIDDKGERIFKARDYNLEDTFDTCELYLEGVSLKRDIIALTKFMEEVDAKLSLMIITVLGAVGRAECEGD